MGSYITLAIVSIVALFILALVALVRCRPEDIPKIVEALARWWRK
jgi:Sec-independent protein translocase protein TatA